MAKALKTLRTHWKKSLFGTGVAIYACYYAYGKYEASLIRRAYCQRAKEFGNQFISPHEKPRHVTVLLNPVANDGRAKDMFEKDAEPLLHLAGLQVSIIKTEQEGQACQLMEVLSDTDAVVIAGGDGTLLEAVTGLMRREDAEKLSQSLPIGIIPLGKHNTLAKRLYAFRKSEEVRWCADAAMAVIEGVTQPLDVLKIESERGKPVFMLSYLKWGSFRDAWERRTKYWYLGPLKSRVTYMLTALNYEPLDIEAVMSFVKPCSGCKNCKIPAGTPQLSWFQRLTRSQQGTSEVDYTKIDNESCGLWQDINIATVDLQVITQNLASSQSSNDEDSKASTEEYCKVVVGPSKIDKLGFIQKGWSKMSDEVELDSNDNTQIVVCREFKLTPKNTLSDRWFAIDSEKYEVTSLHATLLPKKVKVFRYSHDTVLSS